MTINLMDYQWKLIIQFISGLDIFNKVTDKSGIGLLRFLDYNLNPVSPQLNNMGHVCVLK